MAVLGIPLVTVLYEEDGDRESKRRYIGGYCQIHSIGNLCEATGSTRIDWEERHTLQGIGSLPLS